MIGAEDIRIAIAGEAVVLRPSLRHALRLESRPGSFSQLVKDITDGSLSAALDVIGPFTTMGYLPNRVLDELDRLQDPLVRFVVACSGITAEADDADGGEPAAQGKPVSFSTYLTGLYRIGTGWLGWTPQTTLDATPAEIREAHKGRVELLTAIFGSSEEAPKPDTQGMSLDDKFRTVFAGFGTVKAGTTPETGESLDAQAR